ncbi:MAG: Calcineurin-like phosphoesterase [Syntrophorhabdaceae bacterium PtaU1.Bin034]|jgi:3',5'-cyclic AMP phosphodiesterase CpdA|nr:MAG: Calcineurin-like phosphoesterase [Syntrophorhabdaceae bacterium PtaU1.Bin034]
MKPNASRYCIRSVVILLLLFVPLLAWAIGPFAIVSDSHVGAKNSVYGTVIERLDERNVSMIIHAGDAIDRPGSSKQWAKFLEITGPGKTLHLVPGNHDIYGEQSLKVYLRFFPRLYYSFFDGDTLFVLLNTELPGQESMVTGEQFSWLVTELSRSFRYKFVFLHESPYPIVRLHGLDRHEEPRDRLHRLFVQKGVSLVVAGHDHIYGRTEREGITYVIAPQTGGWLPPSFVTNGSSFGYILADRKGSCYSFTVLDMEGKVKDRFSISR